MEELRCHHKVEGRNEISARTLFKSSDQFRSDKVVSVSKLSAWEIYLRGVFGLARRRDFDMDMGGPARVQARQYRLQLIISIFISDELSSQLEALIIVLPKYVRLPEIKQCSR